MRFYLMFLVFFCGLAAAPSEERDMRLESRGIHTLYQEQTLERKIKTMLDYNKHMKYNSDLTVRVYQSMVVVIGAVSEQNDIQDLKAILKERAPHLTQKLYVSVTPELDLTRPSSDSLIRVKVRFALLQGLGWAAGQIRVVVYQKHIYLIGPARLKWAPMVAMASKIGDRVTVVSV